MIGSIIDSPLGPLLALMNAAGGLSGLEFPRGREVASMLRAAGDPVRQDAFGAHVRRALDAYFSGSRAPMDLELAMRGTPFQRTVWSGLRLIPYGVTWTYGQLAEAIGRPGAARAVGRANGSNPVAIIVPCHRVIGAGGRLVGYSGGVRAKRLLLEHEATHGPQESVASALSP